MIRVNFRRSKDGENIIVFYGRLRGGRHNIFSVNERQHVTVDDVWIREDTKTLPYQPETLKDYLASFGYNREEIRVMKRMDYFAKE
jgi:ribosomal protein L24